MARSKWRRPVSLVLMGFACLALAAGTVAAGGAAHAEARLVDATGATIGWALFTEDEAGQLHLNVQVAGLSPGRHGVHLHAIGSCIGPTFASAGGHHNPLGAQHGLDNRLGAHAGDLPNLALNIAGRGHLDAVSDGATLSSGPVALFDSDGSAIVIHAFEDDQVTNPTGNSGPRIACGVISAS
jgi:superoxide dismutase, Cu-Zn family